MGGFSDLHIVDDLLEESAQGRALLVQTLQGQLLTRHRAHRTRTAAVITAAAGHPASLSHPSASSVGGRGDRGDVGGHAGGHAGGGRGHLAARDKGGVTFFSRITGIYSRHSMVGVIIKIRRSRNAALLLRNHWH